MSDALRLTGGDLVQALAGALPAIDAAARRQAEAVAEVLREEAGVAARVTRRGDGDYVVSLEGPGLFAREFGSLDEAGEAAIAPAIAGMRR